MVVRFEKTRRLITIKMRKILILLVLRPLNLLIIKEILTESTLNLGRQLDQCYR